MQDIQSGLPSCVQARRIGHWSYGSDTEYDADGNQATITWICNCGSFVRLEVYNQETGEYTDTPKESLQQFLANHQVCEATCYKCGVVQVERNGLWCEACEFSES